VFACHVTRDGLVFRDYGTTELRTSMSPLRGSPRPRSNGRRAAGAAPANWLGHRLGSLGFKPTPALAAPTLTRMCQAPAISVL
jgi:hypothetical protein